MRRKKEACAECLQRCLQFHGKNKNSPTSFSFFKVMIGDQFTNILYLPPMFAAKMSKSIDQTTFLEDSQGRKWKVTMKSVNGTLAFEKGWSTFASDYNLQVGNFVVFDFIKGSHFFVKVYDTSACQKEFSPRNCSSRKRTRSGQFDAIEVESCDDHDNDSLNRPGSSRATSSGSDLEKSSWVSEKDEHHMNRSAKKPITSEKTQGPKPVCTDDLEEEFCFMINRGIYSEKEVERSPMTDLFDLEMVKESSRTIGVVGGVSNESLRHPWDAPLRSGSGSQPIAENDSKNVLIKNNLASEYVDIKVSIREKNLSIPTALESKGRAQESHVFSEVLKFHTDEVKGNLASTPLSINPFEVRRKEHSSFINSCQTVKHSNIPELNLVNPPNPIQAHNCQHGELGKIIKKERVEMTLGETEKIIKKERVEAAPVKALKIVKEELDEMTPGLFEDEEDLNIMLDCQNPFTIKRDNNEVDEGIGLEVRNSLPSVATISCIVAEDRSFLELPSSLSGQGMRWDRKVVYLLDSVERIWPVLYLETSDNNVLTSGWEAFCRANDIQAGHTCIFKAVNEGEGRYKVSTTRSS